MAKSWADLYCGVEWPTFLMRPRETQPAGPWKAMASADLDVCAGREARQPAANVAVVVPDGWVVVDIDPHVDIEAVRQTLPHDAPTSRTPRGGYHVWLRVPDDVDSRELVQRSITRGVDVRCSWKGWCYEWPSRSPKPGVDGVYTWITPPDEAGDAEAPAWLIEALAPREAADPVDPESIEPLTEEQLASGEGYATAAVGYEIEAVERAQPGERQNTLYRAACAVGRFVAGGYVDADVARARLIAAAGVCGLADEDSEDSIQRQIDRGFAAGAREPARVDDAPRVEIGAAAERPAVELWRADELFADDSPRETPLLAPAMLYPGDLAVVAGPPKSQKSMLLLDLALKTSRGESWCDVIEPTRPLRWLYVNYELRRDHVRGRVELLGGDSPGVLVTGRRLGRARAELWDALTEALERLGEDGPDVVVLDTLAHAYAEDEADNAAMHRWVQATRADVDARWPGAAIVMVHHSAKLSRKELADNPFGSIRGASALRGLYDLGVVVAREHEESDTRRVWFEARGGEVPDSLRIKLGQGGFDAVAGVARIVGQTQAEKWDEQHAMQAQRVIELLITEGAEGRAYTIKTFSEAFGRKDGLPSARGIRSLISQMATRGLVAFSRDLPCGEPLSPMSHGHVVCEGMTYGDEPATPTHHRSAEYDGVLPLGEPMIWGEI